MEEEPKLVKRRLNRHSTMKSGRTIGEKREKLETSNERMAAHKQAKRQKRLRIFFVSAGFLVLIVILIIIYFLFFEKREEVFVQPSNDVATYEPTIEIIDENTTDSGITSRMNEYIGQAEADFRDLGYQPVKAVLPNGSVREVDFYLDGYSGYIKTVVDRGSAISVEDADRMIRYLRELGVEDFKYIDVRIDGKAYWK